VAIWADWAQVSYWVEAILATYIGKWNEMVNLDKASAMLAIKRLEIEVTDGAADSIMLDAPLACSWVTLIDADRYLSRGSLEIGLWCEDLVRKRDRLVAELR